MEDAWCREVPKKDGLEEAAHIETHWVTVRTVS
jgi:hypothetical protein